MVNLYQSDVRSLSDGELRVLSEELSDAYESSCGDDGYWTDEAAETRYWQMRHEIRRRWEVANPEAHALAQKRSGWMVKECLAVLQSSLVANREVSREYDSQFRRQKVGDTIKISRLPRAPWLSVSVK